MFAAATTDITSLTSELQKQRTKPLVEVYTTVPLRINHIHQASGAGDTLQDFTVVDDF